MMVKDVTPIKLRSAQQLGWLDYSIDVHCLGKFRVRRKDHSQKQESLPMERRDIEGQESQLPRLTAVKFRSN